jgi:hypothetical protein
MDLVKNQPHEEDDVIHDANIRSFVIRVWREELTSEKGQPIWRGHITPIPNGRRHYFSDIHDIPVYLAEELKEQS